MTFELIRDILGWCALINIGVLLCWGLAILCFHDLVYRIHSKWFKISVEEFDKIHYIGMAAFKLLFVTLNLVPYLAMRIVG